MVPANERFEAAKVSRSLARTIGWNTAGNELVLLKCETQVGFETLAVRVASLNASRVRRKQWLTATGGLGCIQRKVGVAGEAVCAGALPGQPMAMPIEAPMVTRWPSMT